VRSARWNRFCTQTISVPATACCSCSRLAFGREIRTVICTTNAIESINARLRRAVNARGHSLTEQAALKCLYLAIMSLDPTGKGRQRWTYRWKAALNAFDVTFDGRLSAGRK
jgi:putative transposase